MHSVFEEEEARRGRDTSLRVNRPRGLGLLLNYCDEWRFGGA
jgi:hypothetical protein